MVPGEQPVAAYATFRDSAIFTTKRLIVRDAQGLRGKKVEVYSLPYSSINMWLSENAGSILDFTGELELWTRAGKITISVGKQGGRPAARYADRHVRTGGVDQPETKPAPPRQATHTATYAGAPCGRASISGSVGRVH